MTDLEWLDFTFRTGRIVRSNGEDPDEGMLICNMALHGFWTIEIKAHGWADLIAKGREWEDAHPFRQPKEFPTP